MPRQLDSFTPALGQRWLTPAYDAAIALLTRERAWRAALLAQVAPRTGERILDVGCGTGSLAIALKRNVPGIMMVGLDPDPAVLTIARAKAQAAGVAIEWRQGFARDAAAQGMAFDKTVSSLVFHQVHFEEKRAGIGAMIDAVGEGGEIHLADYACQHGHLMRRLFGLIQLLDGRENTQPNADGAIERLLAERYPEAGSPTARFRTPTGEISLFRLAKASKNPLDLVAGTGPTTTATRWS